MADNSGPTPAEHREATKYEQERIVVRLADELDRMVKLLAWAREAMENELNSGLGYKKLTITDKDLKRLRDLAAVADSVVGAKIRFDKAAKSMADTMTPAEEKMAVKSYLKAAEPADRRDIISDIKKWEARRGLPDSTATGE